MVPASATVELLPRPRRRRPKLTLRSRHPTTHEQKPRAVQRVRRSEDAGPNQPQVLRAAGCQQNETRAIRSARRPDTPFREQERGNAKGAGPNQPLRALRLGVKKTSGNPRRSALSLQGDCGQKDGAKDEESHETACNETGSIASDEFRHVVSSVVGSQTK